jgi:hypothetical protein
MREYFFSFFLLCEKAVERAILIGKGPGGGSPPPATIMETGQDAKS